MMEEKRSANQKSRDIRTKFSFVAFGLRLALQLLPCGACLGIQSILKQSTQTRRLYFRMA
jgi:hypothetical protein